MDACRKPVAERGLGMTQERAEEAIAEARRTIRAASGSDRAEHLGAAILRLNDLYRQAIGNGDPAAALAIQKEINSLLRLPTEQPAAAETGDDPEMALALAHLEPLNLAPPGTGLAELCRLAALRITNGAMAHAG